MMVTHAWSEIDHVNHIKQINTKQGYFYFYFYFYLFFINIHQLAKGDVLQNIIILNENKNTIQGTVPSEFKHHLFHIYKTTLM